MSESARTQRVGEIIKEEISAMIAKDLKDPRIGFVTITDVDVSGDLRYADVYITVLGKKSEREATLEGLQRSGGYLRNELAKRIRIKYMPELRFHFDETVETGNRIEKLIRQIHKEEERND